MENGNQILSELRISGKILLFVDESGTSKKPLPNLESDFQIMCGVTIKSCNYAEICKKIERKLNEIDVDLVEFHTTEIFNPTKKSKWKNISTDNREKALLFLMELIVDYCEAIYICYVSSNQYNEIVNQVKEKYNDKISLSQKDGLKKVFFNSMLKFLSGLNKIIALIMDSEKKLGNEIKLQDVQCDCNIYKNSLLHVKSHQELGLQLADFAAYIYNRSYHTQNRIARGNYNNFDEVVIEISECISSKYINLLST